jgi:sugar lactone lactonase YvrE
MLYWVDIPGKKILRASLDGVISDAWNMPSEPGCIAPARRGGLVIALRDGIYRAAHWHAELVKLASVNFDIATTRFNDGKCDTAGRFWAGSMFEPRTECLAELYCFDARGTVEHGSAPQFKAVQSNATLANGIGWSPDNRTMYWADTVDGVIHAWDWDENTGAMANKRVFQQFPAKPAGWTPENAAQGKTQNVNYQGRPDGCAIDTQGNYYIAMYDGQRILKFAPTGELLAHIVTPTRCTTMPCFGGDDMKTLFITTSRQMRGAEELAAQPLAGHVFSMRVDVPGLPVNFYHD